MISRRPWREHQSPIADHQAHVRRAVLLLSLLITVAASNGCRKGMVDQQHLKPLAEDSFFADDRASRLPPAHTVARGQLHEDEQFFTGKTGDQLATTFPMAVTPEILARGRERYEIHCAVCHGRAGDGEGSVVARGFPQPRPFQEQRLREAPPGYFFNVITNGFGVMYPYASRVAPQDRWAIIAYIGTLQRVRQAAGVDGDLTRGPRQQ